MSFSVHRGPSSVRLCLSLCLLTFHIFIIFSRTTRTISSKLGTMHPCIKAIQECPNEEPLPFPRGDDSEIAKNTLTILIHLLKNQWTNLTKPLGEFKYKWRTQSFSNGREQRNSESVLMILKIKPSSSESFSQFRPNWAKAFLGQGDSIFFFKWSIPHFSMVR